MRELLSTAQLVKGKSLVVLSAKCIVVSLCVYLPLIGTAFVFITNIGRFSVAENLKDRVIYLCTTVINGFWNHSA